MNTHEEEIALLERAIAAGKASNGPGIDLVDDQGSLVRHIDTSMNPKLLSALEERLEKIK